MCLLRVPKPAVISEFVSRMFQVTDQAGAGSGFIVNPSQAANLILTSARI
jgi:hypothetical protein